MKNLLEKDIDEDLVSSQSILQSEDEEIPENGNKKDVVKHSDPLRRFSSETPSAGVPEQPGKIKRAHSSDDPGTVKKIRLIKPLHMKQGKRKKFESEKSLKEREEEEIRLELEMSNAKNSEIETDKFYDKKKIVKKRSLTLKGRRKDVSTPFYKSNAELVQQRRERLKAIAEKNKISNKKQEEPSKPSALKVKSSESKSKTFAHPLPLPHRKRSALTPKESSSCHQEPKASSSEWEDTNKSHDDSESQLKKPRTTAEIRIDQDGDRVISKLSFNNVLSNVFSQDLYAQSKDSDVRKKTPSTSDTKKKSNKATLKTKSGKTSKKTVTWKTNSDGKVHVETKIIPSVGLGRRVIKNNAMRFDSNVRTGSAVSSPALSSVQLSLVHQSQASLPAGVKSFCDILGLILNWKTAWLEEQANLKEEPPVQGTGIALSHVPPVFASYRDYCNTFYPLLLHDLWASVYRDYEEFSKEKCLETMMVVTNMKPEQKFCNFRLLAVLTEDERKLEYLLPTDGCLCKIELRVGDGKRCEVQIRPMFGYATYSRIIRYQSNSNNEIYLKPLLDVALTKRRRYLRYVLEVDMITKILPKHIILTQNKPIIVKSISRIKSSLRPVEAIQNMYQSVLFQTLLFPRQQVKRFSIAMGNDDVRPDVAGLPAVKNLNPRQLEVVKSCAKNATINMREPHVSLIQGPPGTGKTSTIVGIILQIFSRWRHYNPGAPLPRILLAAPSNTAVDEIASRLLQVRGQLPKSTFNMIRIGREKTVRHEVRGICLDNLREQETERRLEQMSNASSVSMEIRQRQEVINRLGDDLKRHVDNQDEIQITLVTRKIKEERDRLQRARNSKLKALEVDTGKLRRETAECLLEHADIIATTLSSSLNGPMCHYFLQTALRPNRMNQRHNPFSICIVDEATQSVEPETLVPLKLGFSKLILVGDPEQLPATVTSQQAKTLSFNMSIFHRLYNQLNRPSEDKCPIQRLNVQYRMHPEIARWPNMFFYGGILRNGPQNRDTPLAPLLLFDLKSSTEQICDTSKHNLLEAKFVARLVEALYNNYFKGTVSRLAVGVITFYSKQVNAIRAELNKVSLSSQVPVRTVDGYQGSESDIIIISCVRSQKRSGIGFLAETERLNVALTRARHALYVVGNFEAFMVS